MCYGNPTKSLAIARSRMTPEAWSRFEREFEDWCITSGLEGWMYQGSDARAWMKWAFFSARPVIEHNQCCDTPAFCSSVRRCTAKDADRRITDAYHETIAIASMTDEQAWASLERWYQVTEVSAPVAAAIVSTLDTLRAGNARCKGETE